MARKGSRLLGVGLVLLGLLFAGVSVDAVSGRSGAVLAESTSPPTGG